MKDNTSKAYLIISVSVILVLCSCASPKYFVERESEIIKWNLDRNVINYIPLTDSELKKSEILDSTYHLLIKTRYGALNSYLKSIEKTGVNTSDFFLSKSLLNISRKDYLLAMQDLEKINNDDYKILKSLLKIDMNYEILRMKNISTYDKFLKDYQELIDTYPDNSLLKTLVTMRLRYIRYNK